MELEFKLSYDNVWSYSITFSDSLFINPVRAHTVLERSTDKEWHNPSGSSSDGRGDLLATQKTKELFINN